MPQLAAHGAVAVLAALLSSAGCYSVPELASSADSGPEAHDDADASQDATSPGDAGMPVDSGADVSTHGDSGAKPDAACMGVLCPCNNASDCSSHVCAQSITVGPAVYAAAGGNNFCTAGCCTSADCPSGTVCFASGAGGQYCVSPQWLGRPKPASTAMSGASCSTGSACRSGVCAGSICVDTCCSLGASSECTGGTSCVFGTFPGQSGIDTHFAPHCGAAGAGAYGDVCAGNTDCQGGLCYQSGMGGNCTNPCRNPADCSSGNACQVDEQGTDVYAACFPWAGTGGQGAACSSDTACLGDWCGTTGQCTGICFTDADCTVVGWHCTPQPSTLPSGTYLLLACGP